MGKRGNNPLSVEAKKHRGTYRSDRPSATTPQPEETMPTCPEFLPNGARAEWTRVAHRLYNLGLLTCLDRAALAAYCYNYDLWMTALEALKSEDMVVETANGSLVQNPLLGIANRAQERMRTFGGLFGLNPSSRSRIIAVPPKPEKQAKPSDKKVVTGFFE